MITAAEVRPDPYYGAGWSMIALALIVGLMVWVVRGWLYRPERNSAGAVTERCERCGR